MQFGLASDDLLTLVASAPSGIFSRQLQSNLSSVAAKFALVPFCEVASKSTFSSCDTVQFLYSQTQRFIRDT